MERLLQSTEYQGITWHVWRRAVATMFISRGATMPQLLQWGRWRSLRVARKYIARWDRAPGRRQSPMACRCTRIGWGLALRLGRVQSQEHVASEKVYPGYRHRVAHRRLRRRGLGRRNSCPSRSIQHESSNPRSQKNYPHLGVAGQTADQAHHIRSGWHQHNVRARTSQFQQANYVGTEILGGS